LESLVGGLGVGLFSYILARPRNVVKKHGIDPKRFDALDFQNLTQKIENTNVLDYLVTRPRRMAAATTLATLVAGYNTNTSLFQIPVFDLAFATFSYLLFRRAFMGAQYHFHSSSQKGILPINLAWWANFLNKFVKSKRLESYVIERFEEAARINPNAKPDLARAYLKKGRYTDGLLQIKEALEEEEYSGAILFVKGRGLLFSAASSFSIKEDKRQPENYVSLAVALSSIGERERALRTVEEFSEKFPGISEDIDRALLLERIGEQEKSRMYWGRVVDAVYSNKNRKILPGGEGIHQVVTYDLPGEIVSSTLRIKKQTTKETLSEQQRNLVIRKANPECLIHPVIGTYQHNGYSDLILRCISGQTMGQIGVDDKDAYHYTLQAMYFTEWFHRTLDPSISEVGRINLHKKFQTTLNSLSHELDKKTISDLHHIAFILDMLSDSPFAVARDNHPWQYIITGNTRNKFAPVDFGDMGVDAIPRDAAKLITHTDTPLSSNYIVRLLEDAAVPYKEDSIFTDPQEFVQLSLMAALVQPLSYYGSWSSGNMKHMLDKRLGTVSKVPAVLDIMQQEQLQKDYARHQADLVHIADGFKRIEDKLLSKLHTS